MDSNQENVKILDSLNNSKNSLQNTDKSKNINEQQDVTKTKPGEHQKIQTIELLNDINVQSPNSISNNTPQTRKNEYQTKKTFERAFSRYKSKNSTHLISKGRNNNTHITNTVIKRSSSHSNNGMYGGMNISRYSMKQKYGKSSQNKNPSRGQDLFFSLKLYTYYNLLVKLQKDTEFYRYNFILKDNYDCYEMVKDLTEIDLKRDELKKKNKQWKVQLQKIVLVYNFISKILKKMNVRVLHPNGTIVIIFEWIEVITIILLGMVQSFFVFYGYNDYYVILCFNLVGILIFLMVMIQKINTGFFNNFLELIDDRKKILKEYKKLYFFQDVLGILTLIYNSIYFDISLFHKLVSLIFMLKVFNVFKLVQSLQDKMNLAGNWVYLWELTKLFCQSTFLCHCIACAYHLVGLIQQEYFDEDIYGKIWFDTNQSWSQRYIQSFYWALSSMMGGSTSGQTFIETLFSCLVMMGTVAVFATILGTIQIILEDIQKKSKDYKKSKEILTQFFKNQPAEVVIPQQIKSRLSNYLRYYYIGHEDMKQAEDFENIMQNLPESLQESIKVVRFTSLVNKFTILKNNFTPYIMEKLVDCVKEEYYMPNQIVVQQDEYRQPKLFLVVKGQINLEYSIETNAIETIKKQQLKGFKKDWVINKEQKRLRQQKLNQAKPTLQKFQKYEKLVLNTISNSTIKTKHEVFIPKSTKKRNVIIKTLNESIEGENNYFGESFFFTDKAPEFTARSSSFTTLLSIDREKFMQIIKDSQQDFEKFHYFKDCIIQNGHCEQVYKKCIICLSQHHNLQNCKLLRYNPNKLNVIAKYNYYQYDPSLDKRDNQFFRNINPRQLLRLNRLKGQLQNTSLHNLNENAWKFQNISDKASELQIKCWQREDELSNKYHEQLEILEKFQPYGYEDVVTDQSSLSSTSTYDYQNFVSQITEESQSDEYTSLNKSNSTKNYQFDSDQSQQELIESQIQKSNDDDKNYNKLKVNGNLQNKLKFKNDLSPMHQQIIKTQVQGFKDQLKQQEDLSISNTSFLEEEFQEGQQTQRIKKFDNIQSQLDHNKNYQNNEIQKLNLKKQNSQKNKYKNSIIQVIQNEIQKLQLNKTQSKHSRSSISQNNNSRKNSIQKKKQSKSFNKLINKKKNNLKQLIQNRRKSLFSQDFQANRDLYNVNRDLFNSTQERRQSIMSQKSTHSYSNPSTPGQLFRNRIQNTVQKHHEAIDTNNQFNANLQIQQLRLINDIQQMLDEKQQANVEELLQKEDEWSISFDKFKNYKWYYPWNNQSHVCSVLKKMMKRISKMKQVVKAFEESSHYNLRNGSQFFQHSQSHQNNSIQQIPQQQHYQKSIHNIDEENQKRNSKNNFNNK